MAFAGMTPATVAVSPFLAVDDVAWPPKHASGMWRERALRLVPMPVALTTSWHIFPRHPAGALAMPAVMSGTAPPWVVPGAMKRRVGSQRRWAWTACAPWREAWMPPFCRWRCPPCPVWHRI